MDGDTSYASKSRVTNTMENLKNIHKSIPWEKKQQWKLQEGSPELHRTKDGEQVKIKIFPERLESKTSEWTSQIYIRRRNEYPNRLEGDSQVEVLDPAEAIYTIKQKLNEHCQQFTGFVSASLQIYNMHASE